MTPPKFQYQPNMTDVWRRMPGVAEHLSQEADSSYSHEVGEVVALLYQRDRQLEDYLSGLQVGGGGGLNYSAFVLTPSGPPVYGDLSAGTAPTVTEQWVTPMTVTPLASTPTAPTLGVEQAWIHFTYLIDPATPGVQFYGLVTGAGGNLGLTALPWIKVAGTGTTGQVYNSELTTFGAIGAVTLTVVAYQAAGSPLLGAGAVTVSSAFGYAYQSG